MSKSKGEFLTVSLLEEKGYDPIVYRFFCLQSHYRKSLVFSYENLDNAATSFNKLVTKISALHACEPLNFDSETYEFLKRKFEAALDNDLNTSLAITALYDVIKADTTPATKIKLIDDFDKVLSLELNEKAKNLLKNSDSHGVRDDGNICATEIEALIEERAQAKKSKNYERADEIRNILQSKNIVLEDTPTGVRWKRI